jgi:hypothetical protein
MVAKADQEALTLFNSEPAEAIEYLTTFSNDIGDQLLKDWFALFGQLFVKYRDGYITTAAPEVPVCGCSTSSVKYQDEWYNRIAEDTGDLYLVPEGDTSSTTASRAYREEHPTISKLSLRAFQ